MLTGAAGAVVAAGATGVAGCFPDVGGQWPEAASCGVCTPSDGGGGAEDDAAETLAPVQGASMVATIQRDDSVDGRGKSLEQPQLDAVKSMVDAVLSTLAGGADNPWPVLLPMATPSCTRIGLKVNCLNPFFPTSPAVVSAIIASLVGKGGFCPGNIVVWDRRLDELKGTGQYKATHLQGAQMVGTVNSTTDPGGPGYATGPWGVVSGASPRLSRILTEHTDITINCPVLKTHGESGVTGAFKNIYGIIDNPSDYHGDVLAMGLPSLFRIPHIRKSIKLTIVDALQAVILGDTASRPEAIPGRIFASLDPLAIDFYARDLVNQLRAVRNQKPVNSRMLAWLDNGYQMGLGAKSYRLASLRSDGTVDDSASTLDGGAALDSGAVDVGQI
jgi:uncharacterized protein (DUF362 family)